MVAPEDHPLSIANYSLHMKMVAYLTDHGRTAKAALHAGELSMAYAAPEALRDHIAQAVRVAAPGASATGSTCRWRPARGPGRRDGRQGDPGGGEPLLQRRHPGVSGKAHPMPGCASAACRSACPPTMRASCASTSPMNMRAPPTKARPTPT
uniref:Uncharacterized protein n=1 Tax=Phenylobacterium glaciei TaxID=2803784 RepID=A0A974P1A5_9CAUL|nr:hypothetical protein JKL49_18200 [Phenylobacterium glaciei]